MNTRSPASVKRQSSAAIKQQSSAAIKREQVKQRLISSDGLSYALGEMARKPLPICSRIFGGGICLIFFGTLTWAAISRASSRVGIARSTTEKKRSDLRVDGVYNIQSYSAQFFTNWF